MRNLVSNLNWVMAANSIAGIANLFTIAWFARTLGPGEMGDYALIVTVAQVVVALLSAGFDQAVIRSPHDGKLVAAAGFATVTQALLIAACGGLVYFGSYLWFPEDALRLSGAASGVMAAMVLTIFSNLFAAPIAAKQEYRFLAIARLIAILVGIAFGVSLAIQGLGFYALVCRDVLSAIVLLLVFGARGARGLSWTPSTAGLKKLLSFARGMWALNFSERLVIRIDYGLVGIIFGKDILGAYFVVRGMVEGALGFLVYPVQTVMFSYYCRVADVGHQPSHWVRRGAYAYVAAAILVVLLAWRAAPAVIDAFLGQAYAHASLLVPLLLAYAAAVLWFENVKVLAMSQGLHERLLFCRVIQLVALLALIGPFVIAFGMAGAALATASGGLVLALSASWLAPLASRVS